MSVSESASPLSSALCTPRAPHGLSLQTVVHACRGSQVLVILSMAVRALGQRKKVSASLEVVEEEWPSVFP